MALEFLIPGLGAFYIDQGKTGLIWFLVTAVLSPIIYFTTLSIIVYADGDGGGADSSQIQGALGVVLCANVIFMLWRMAYVNNMFKNNRVSNPNFRL